MACTTAGGVRGRIVAALAAFGMSVPSPGFAGDGDLQRALLESGCVNARVTRLPDQAKVVIYRANCFGTEHKVIEVVCITGRCTVGASSPEEERAGSR